MYNESKLTEKNEPSSYFNFSINIVIRPAIGVYIPSGSQSCLRSKYQQTSNMLLALFIRLIICLIQLVFSAGTVFFSHKKSANSVFQPAYNSS
jgi:hypothetical protein